MTDESNTRQFSSKDLVMRGTIMALIIVIPSITAFFISWTILDDLFSAIVIGALVHFIAMGFSLKLSKKFLSRNTKKDDYQ